IRGGGRKWGRLWVSDPEPPKYGLIRGRNRAFRFLSSRVSDCRAADSRNFEENSNRDWLQAPRKTPPKAVRRSPQGRIQVPSFAKLRSGRLLRLKCVLFVQHSPEKDQRRRCYKRFLVVS